MDRTVLRMGVTVAVVLVLAMMRAPWWIYVVWAILVVVTAPFYLTATHVIDESMPEECAGGSARPLSPDATALDVSRSRVRQGASPFEVGGS